MAVSEKNLEDNDGCINLLWWRPAAKWMFLSLLYISIQCSRLINWFFDRWHPKKKVFFCLFNFFNHIIMQIKDKHFAMKNSFHTLDTVVSDCSLIVPSLPKDVMSSNDSRFNIKRILISSTKFATDWFELMKQLSLCWFEDEYYQVIQLDVWSIFSCVRETTFSLHRHVLIKDFEKKRNPQWWMDSSWVFHIGLF